MFGSNKYTKEQYESIASQLNDAMAEKLALDSRLEQASLTIEAFAAKEANYKKVIKSHTTELDNLKLAHSEQLKKLEKSINRKVNTTLASIGVSEFAHENFSVSPKKTDQEVYNGFLALAGGEQTEYYNKNKEVIARFLANINK